MPKTDQPPTGQTQPGMPQNAWARSKRAVLLFLALLLMFAGGTYGVFAWQHRKVGKLNKKVAILNANVTALTKQKMNLTTQVAQLNKSLAQASSKTSGSATVSSPSSLTTQSQPSSDSSNATTTPATPSSEMIINDITQVPINKYWPQYTGSSTDTYAEVDFTIYNNSDQTQQYSLSEYSNWIKGVSATGEIVTPNIPMGSEWLGATIEAGGSATGFAMFNLPLNIVALQWTYPGSSQPVTVPLPTQNN